MLFYASNFAELIRWHNIVLYIELHGINAKLEKLPNILHL